MSQVQHGSKMLTGLPDDLAPPSVRANSKVFFVNELLRQSTGGYFIPTRLFQARIGPTSETEVLALGHKVSQTNVSSKTCPFSRFHLSLCRKGLPLIRSKLLSLSQPFLARLRSFQVVLNSNSQVRFISTLFTGTGIDGREFRVVYSFPTAHAQSTLCEVRGSVGSHCTPHCFHG